MVSFSSCNLKLCSKSDQFLVTSTRHVAQIISIAEQSNSSCNELSTIILRYEFRVLQLEEIDGVTTMTSGEYQKINNKNRYDVARSWIEKISENGVANAKKVQLLNVTWPRKRQNSASNFFLSSSSPCPPLLNGFSTAKNL